MDSRKEGCAGEFLYCQTEEIGGELRFTGQRRFVGGLVGLYERVVICWRSFGRT